MIYWIIGILILIIIIQWLAVEEYQGKCKKLKKENHELKEKLDVFNTIRDYFNK
jgi:hypothetical protein